MLGWVLLKKVTKGNGASREDDFVRLDLLSAVTGEGDVHKLGLVSQVCEGCLDALLEVIPLQAKLLICGTAHPAWQDRYSTGNLLAPEKLRRLLCYPLAC